MATYNELYSLRNDQGLLEKVSVAITKAAAAVAVEDPGTANHAARFAWARAALGNPLREAEQAIWILLANAAGGATVAQLKATSDASVQTAVDGIVNLLASTS